LSQGGSTNVLVPPYVAGALFTLTLAMCIGAALVSIHKVTKIDPAIVFKA
jgi:putative ABC transport system permease protein